MLNYGKFPSDERVSQRILHVEISVTRQQTVEFYGRGLSLREFWRADPTMSRVPGAPPVDNAKNTFDLFGWAVDGQSFESEATGKRRLH